MAPLGQCTRNSFEPDRTFCPVNRQSFAEHYKLDTLYLSKNILAGYFQNLPDMSGKSGEFCVLCLGLLPVRCKPQALFPRPQSVTTGTS